MLLVQQGVPHILRFGRAAFGPPLFPEPPPTPTVASLHNNTRGAGLDRANDRGLFMGTKDTDSHYRRERLVPPC